MVYTVNKSHVGMALKIGLAVFILYVLVILTKPTPSEAAGKGPKVTAKVSKTN